MGCKRDVLVCLVEVAVYTCVLVCCCRLSQGLNVCEEAVKDAELTSRPMPDVSTGLFGLPGDSLKPGFPPRCAHDTKLSLLRHDNDWKNSLVAWLLPQAVAATMPRLVLSWFRNMIFTGVVYLVASGTHSYYIYICFGDKLFKPGMIPPASVIADQIKVALRAVPVYAVLPTATEFMAEQGWTRAFARIDQVGLPMHLIFFVLYVAAVECGIYWIHRISHDGWAFRRFHSYHHKYNQEHMLSPFTSIAFDPIDGLIAALPYPLALLFCPAHYFTMEMVLFANALWTANIHDRIHCNVMPIMGAGYHMIHHTACKHNYGNFLIYMDWAHGTLRTPEEHAAAKTAQLDRRS